MMSLNKLAGVGPTDPAAQRPMLEALEKRCLLSANLADDVGPTDVAVYQGRLKLRGEAAEGVTVTVRPGDDGSISGMLSSASTGGITFSGTLNRRRLTVQLQDSGDADSVLVGKVSPNGMRLRGRLADGPGGASGRLSLRAVSRASAGVLAAEDDLPPLGPPQEPPIDTVPPGGELPPTDNPPGVPPGTDPGTDPETDPGTDPEPDPGGGPFPGMPDLPPPRWEVGLGPKPDLEGDYSGSFQPINSSSGEERGTGIDPVPGFEPRRAGPGPSPAASNGATLTVDSQSEDGGLEGTLSIPGVGDFTFTGKLGFAYNNEFRLILSGDGSGYVRGAANDDGSLVAEFVVNTSSGEQRGALSLS